MDSKQKIKKLVQKLKAERKKMDEPKAPKESKKKEQADKPEKEQAPVYVGPKGGKYIQTKTGKRKYKSPDSKPAQKDDRLYLSLFVLDNFWAGHQPVFGDAYAGH